MLRIINPCSVYLMLAVNIAAAGSHDREIADLVKAADETLTSRPELAVVNCTKAIRLDSG